MKYLLDTHTLIWSVTEEWKLSDVVRQTLQRPDNILFASTINFWEISLKYAKGKLELQGFLPEDIPNLSLKSGFQIISVSAEETSSYYRLSVTDQRPVRQDARMAGHTAGPDFNYKR